MKNLVLTGTIVSLILSASSTQAQSKDFIERTAREIIDICESKKGRDIGDLDHGVCLVTENLSHKGYWEMYPSDYAKRNQECIFPIKRKLNTLR